MTINQDLHMSEANVFEFFLEMEREAQEFGFYWSSNYKEVIKQILSEIAEVEEVIDKKESFDRLEDELGDMLHAVSCLCYVMKINPEKAFQQAIEKFKKRLEHVKKIEINHDSPRSLKNIFTFFGETEKEAQEFGFHWSSNYQEVIEQVRTKVVKIEGTIDKKESADCLEDQLGDILYGACRLCGVMKVDSEKAFERAIKKFKTRFEEVKKIAKEEGYPHLKGQPLDVLWYFWRKAKKNLSHC